MSAAVFDRYLTEAEERQLLTHVGAFSDVLARRDHAWMRLMRQVGIRVGALAGLTVDDARQALHTNYLPLDPEHAKRGKGGRVFVTRDARRALRDLLQIRRELGYPDIGDQPLIMSRNHTGISVRSLQHRMATWVRASGLQVAASPHWWRHTLGKRVMARSTAKDPQGIVQQQLNHSSRSSTVIYTRPDREDLETALEEAS